MEPQLATTPFGRRPLTLAHVAAQMAAKQRPPEAAAHKWNVFRAICTARRKLGLSERALAVLDALLSFHPETVLSGDGLVVFPSNAQLSLRAHGMAPSTLRRHLAALVDAGLILRRDSPNGKRYARKGRDGGIDKAFGFDLAPLAARAAEFEALALKDSKPGVNESQTERHLQNSNSQSPVELESAFEKSEAKPSKAVMVDLPARKQTPFPLSLVLQACPDIVDYTRGGVANWRDLLAAASVARAALGVSPSAFAAAVAALGETDAAIAVAAILQRGAAIHSAGGYLRELARKAETGQFSVGPMLMALVAARNRARKRA